MASWSQLSLSDAASPVMEEFSFFHDYTLVILVFIMGVVGYMMFMALISRALSMSVLEGQLLEGLWTSIPALILVQIAIPSLVLLYSLDESAECGLTIKAMGHQWYWSYEYTDFGTQGTAAEFDSYMADPKGLADSGFRLLDVDNRTVLPWGSSIRVLVGSADVLHSWAVPAMGVKADACPGRLNQVKLLSHRPGLFFGQCSEICGANHSFMPIVLEMVQGQDFLLWLETL